ncbi:MAG TPA: hypothetical protein VI585_16540, partial [Candidatus Binatia bacterium]
PARHTRESGYPEVFDFPGFRVALAIASLPGMTTELFKDFGNTTLEERRSGSCYFANPRVFDKR